MWSLAWSNSDYDVIMWPELQTVTGDDGLCLSLTGEAVFARCLSSLKDERVQASKSLTGPQGVKFTGSKAQFLEDIRKVGWT